ncbi:MAG: tyrosine-type recombinase/integrase [Planctomycetes bacterium]|nr:tyrosine-type recombinase/integrase [Planctomycetota bacterium]
MRTPSAIAKSGDNLLPAARATARLWRRFRLGYDQTRRLSRLARGLLGIVRPRARRGAANRLSREEAETLIAAAYKQGGVRGLMLKTLFQSGMRVSEFASLRCEDLSFEEQSLFVSNGKGSRARYVPILPELAQELRTHLRGRTAGDLFESVRGSKFSARRIQQIVGECARLAGITNKRVYPHLLRHSVATYLLSKGMELEKIQKFLGHESIETTTIYAESTPDLIRDSYRKAMGRT